MTIMVALFALQVRVLADFDECAAVQSIVIVVIIRLYATHEHGLSRVVQRLSGLWT